jgi:hypothetical protein
MLHITHLAPTISEIVPRIFENLCASDLTVHTEWSYLYLNEFVVDSTELVI